jgi:putative pyruvate formate lyase activating enzyme
MNTDRKIERIDWALAALEPNEESCSLCPRNCRVNRRRGETGICQSADQAGVARALLHFGEEPVLSGAAGRGRGSGTIFFTGCNLKCLYCQNYQISWLMGGSPASDEKLAGMMLDLQDRGAYNLNLVSPSHLLLPILRGLRIAYSKGLSLPVVYNSNGYEKAEVIEYLAGIVDIYLPDCKYKFAEASRRLSGAADYFDYAGPTLEEMFFQQPDLVLDEDGLAVRGTIIRHLVLPGQVENSIAVFEWLAEAFPRSLALSLMSQYRPCFQAPADLQRPVTSAEYSAVLARARELGFENVFVQPDLFGPEEHLNPNFDLDEPFPWKK